MNEIQQKHTNHTKKCTKSPRALQAKIHQDPVDPNSSKWPGMMVIVGDGGG
jgi:hypothetical protein